jgi:hypothetical protein
MEYSEERHIAIQDLGTVLQEKDPFESLEGIYAVRSLFKWKTLYLTAQGMLELAAYIERNRAKLEQEASRSIISLPDDRYYVQALSATNYLVRERLEVGQQTPDDPVVKEFGDKRPRAYAFAGHLNNYQRQLDARYGHWVRHAAISREAQDVKSRPLPDVAPFQFGWYSSGLGPFRPCGRAYCRVPYEELPPLPEELFQGTLDWLPPLGKGLNLQGMDHYHSEADLQRIIASAQQLDITLPDAFLQCTRSPDLLECIPSCTDCYFDLSVSMAVHVGTEGGYLIRFLIDRQGVIAWYLYLTPRGKQFVLVGNPWLNELNTPETSQYIQADRTDEQGQNGVELEKLLEVCLCLLI